MELILKENVENLGFKGDIVKVKSGYGRNFLIPKGKAILATPSSKKILEENIKQQQFKDKKVIDEANEFGNKLKKLKIKISSKARFKRNDKFTYYLTKLFQMVLVLKVYFLSQS